MGNGITFNVGTTSLRELREKLGATIQEMIEGGVDGLIELTDIGKEYAKESAPEDTGHLRESIHSFITKPQRYRIVGVWGSTAKYAPYVELGTGPVGEQTPVDGKYTGPEISYKEGKWRVNIPGVGVRWIAGMKARPYMWPSACYVRSRMTDVLIKNIQNKMGGR